MPNRKLQSKGKGCLPLQSPSPCTTSSATRWCNICYMLFLHFRFDLPLSTLCPACSTPAGLKGRSWSWVPEDLMQSGKKLGSWLQLSSGWYTWYNLWPVSINVSGEAGNAQHALVYSLDFEVHKHSEIQAWNSVGPNSQFLVLGWKESKNQISNPGADVFSV